MKNKIYSRNLLLTAVILASIPLATQAESSAGEPAVTGTSSIDHEATLTPSTNSTDPKNPTTCTAHNKNYASMYEGMWDKGPSIMSECGIGRLVDFDILQIFDPIGALLDAMQGAICGWVNDAVNPFVTSYNDTASRANEWTSDTNRGYDDWVSDRQDAIYDELYAKYQATKDSGLADIGNPYEGIIFSDPANYPTGYDGDGTEYDSDEPSNQNTDGVTGSGGSLDSNLNDGDIIIIGNDTPIIIDNEPQEQIINTRSVDSKTSNYDEIYSIFNK